MPDADVFVPHAQSYTLLRYFKAAPFGSREQTGQVVYELAISAANVTAYNRIRVFSEKFFDGICCGLQAFRRERSIDVIALADASDFIGRQLVQLHMPC
jgi:hypothetical protein